METEKKPIAPASKNAILEMLAKTDSSGQNFIRHISLNKKSMIKSKFRFLRTMVNKLEKNMNAQKGSQIGNPSIHIRPEKALFRKIKQSANTEQISLNLLVNRILRNYFNEVNPA